MCKRSYSSPFYCYLSRKANEAVELSKRDVTKIMYALDVSSLELNYHRFFFYSVEYCLVRS